MKLKSSLVLALSVLSISTLMIGDKPVWAENAKMSENAAADTNDKESPSEDSILEDGVYSAEFDTDSSMFHVNEANEGRGTLTVKDGKMTIHVSLVSKSILLLFQGTAEDAQKDGAKVIEPTTDIVTYSDGISEEVYGFDIPVPALDEEFDVALIGKKGKWYGHKVKVTDPQPIDMESEGVSPEELNLKDGSYTVSVTLEGGSGKAAVEEMAGLVLKDGKALATITWSSPNYDYMIVDGEKYTMLNTEGNSVFEIPVLGFDYKMPVIADTVAMSEPHEIEYLLQFDSASIREAEK